ncbi:MAG: site-specific integrase [Bacteroidota bacterium]|jgi:site-specific recombinase XerD
MASIIQRKNGVWYGVFSYRGKRVWRTTGTRSSEEAKSIVQSMEKEYVTWKNVTVGKFRVQLTDILKGQLQDSTIALFDQALRKLAELVGDKLLRSVGPYDVERFKSQRLKQVSATRVAIEYRQLKAAFSRAVQFGIIPKNPFKEVKNVKIPEKEPLFLSPDEFGRLMESTADQQLRAIMLFAVCTSMRVGELVNVRWPDIDLVNRVIQLKNRPDFTLKGKRQRPIPVNDTCLSLLETMDRRSEFLFCNRKGGKLSARWVSERFRRAKEKAGFPKGIHMHSLRHTGASWLVQAGVPLAYVQRILGHYSITTTQIYVHSVPEHLQESVVRLDTLLASIYRTPKPLQLVAPQIGPPLANR